MSSIDRIRAELKELGANALLVTGAANVRFLSRFTNPEFGMVLILADSAVLLTDPAHAMQARLESSIEVDASSDWPARVALWLAGAPLAVEADHMTLALHHVLAHNLQASPIPVEDLVARARVIKTQEEIHLLREAARILDCAFERAMTFIQVGMSELAVALELQRIVCLEGATVPPDGIRVASGPRTAMPEGVATARTIHPGDLLTLDCDAAYQGYHARLVRTLPTGQAPDALMQMIAAVGEAQAAALAAASPQATGHDVDAAARQVLTRHGLEDTFIHDVGHGTGLAPCEAPKLAPHCATMLQPGMALVVGPGVYLEGVGGARVTDLSVMTEVGCDLLTRTATRLSLR